MGCTSSCACAYARALFEAAAGPSYRHGQCTATGKSTGTAAGTARGTATGTGPGTATGMHRPTLASMASLCEGVLKGRFTVVLIVPGHAASN